MYYADTSRFHFLTHVSRKQLARDNKRLRREINEANRRYAECLLSSKAAAVQNENDDKIMTQLQITRNQLGEVVSHTKQLTRTIIPDLAGSLPSGPPPSSPPPINLVGSESSRAEPSGSIQDASQHQGLPSARASTPIVQVDASSSSGEAIEEPSDHSDTGSSTSTELDLVIDDNGKFMTVARPKRRNLRA